MPFTPDQLSCFVSAAADSTAVQTYFDVSALLGLAAVYGNASAGAAGAAGNASAAGAALMAELLASPDVAELLQLPLSNVTAAYEAWVDEAMQACGMPALTDASGAELTPGERAG